jgi:chromosome partitioning protein
MTKIIGLVQLKGGVGRSTLATNLTGMLAEQYSVALIDCDAPQLTCSHWLNQRKSLYEIDETIDLYQPNNYRSLHKTLTDIQGKYDYVVIDCPPRLDGFSKVALTCADLVLLPLGPSAAEIWSVEEMLAVLKEAKQVNPNIDARILWNRFRGYTKSANENAATAKKSLKLPEMKTRVSLRVAYADALSEGLTVHEYNDKNARLEIWSLTSSITRALAKKSSKLPAKQTVLEFAKKH